MLWLLITLILFDVIKNKYYSVFFILDPCLPFFCNICSLLRANQNFAGIFSFLAHEASEIEVAMYFRNIYLPMTNHVDRRRLASGSVVNYISLIWATECQWTAMTRKVRARPTLTTVNGSVWRCPPERTVCLRPRRAYVQSHSITM